MSTVEVSDIAELSSVNLADPATHSGRDLSSVWRLLRGAAPVYRHPATEEGPPFWVLSRHADVQAVYRDSERFTSERGNVLTTLLRGGDSAAGKMLAVTDGGRQRELRNVLLKAFSPRVLSRVVERIEANTSRWIRESTRLGRFDFVSTISERIPITTICDLLGVPEADRPTLLRLNKSVLSSDDPNESFTDAWAARNEILLYFAQLAEERRKNPRDDVITGLAIGTIDGKRLTEEEIILNCYSLIIGGDETARMSMSTAVHAFTEHPGQWRALKEARVGVHTAVEEVLRWATPAMHFGRVARQDVTLHDRTIRAGDIVTLWNCSANRDEDVFADPYTYDLGRPSNKHLTFGYGQHFCLGAHLARAEIGALLTALREHVDRIEPAGPIQHVYSNFLSGISELPVTMSPAA